jgi:hypothetical protein
VIAPWGKPIIAGRFFAAFAFVEKWERVMQICKLVLVHFFAGWANSA